MILDYDKIESLPSMDYDTLKTALGLGAQEYTMYNFNIGIRYDESTPLSYGADYDYSSVVASDSIAHEVLVYHKPQISDLTVTTLPYYEKARITFRLFIGGIPP